MQTVRALTILRLAAPLDQNVDPTRANMSRPLLYIMQAQHVRRRDMGHVPYQNDGTKTIFELVDGRNSKRHSSQKCVDVRVLRRRVVASAATNICTESKKPQTYMDSGTSTTICDDDELYIPESVMDCPGEVVWGDGSTRRIKYTGQATGTGKMVNTGGAASTHLVSVGATLDELKKTTNNGDDFVMGFDNDASFLIRGARFEKGNDGKYRLRQDDVNAPVLQTSVRDGGSSGVYKVPLYDAAFFASAKKVEEYAFRASIKRVYGRNSHLFSYPKEPVWGDLKYAHTPCTKPGLRSHPRMSMR